MIILPGNNEVYSSDYRFSRWVNLVWKIIPINNFYFLVTVAIGRSIASDDDLVITLREILGRQQVTQAQLQQAVAQNGALYAGASRNNPNGRITASRNRGDAYAIYAPTTHMKTDENGLIRNGRQYGGNQNKILSGVPNKPGWTYALLPPGVQWGAPAAWNQYRISPLVTVDLLTN